MGNRIQGFLGGVLLTGFLTVTTAAAIKQYEQTTRMNIQHCDDTIKYRILSNKNPNESLIPVNRRVFITHRPSVWETCKDIWNDEIIKAANFMYSINWYNLGLEADKKLNKLADKLVSLAAEKK